MAGKDDYSLASPVQIAADLGETLTRLRLAQNVSQSELADKAGISERTLRRLEAGEGCTLDTLIRVMQAMELAEQLATLLPDPGIMPVERMARGGREPKRVSRKRHEQDDEGWSWDEEETP